MIKGDITADSREVKAGDAFVCIKGKSVDGHDFAKTAVKSGASVIFATRRLENFEGVDVRYFENETALNTALNGVLRERYPLQPQIFAVTGTNGKSSVVHFCVEICKMIGVKAVSVGTLGVRFNFACENAFETSLTTPDKITLKKILHQAALNGAEYAFLEASSIGVEQGRLDTLDIIIAGFTNLSPDHLDYHGDMAEYFRQKKRLFSDILNHNGIAILNADTSECAEIKTVCKGKVITYGAGGDFKITNTKFNNKRFAYDFAYNYKGLGGVVETCLTAEFQVENLACAVLGVVGLGADFTKILPTLPHICQPNGRLEYIKNERNLHIFVDYAHTPDALEKTLLELQKLTPKRLICLFGCGGDRDRSKRSLMGEIAGKYADFTIITDDNPRFEEANEIRRQIMSKMSGDFIEIPGRKEAIKAGIEMMQAGDILLIAGRGHENFQYVKGDLIEFNDKTVAKNYLK